MQQINKSKRNYFQLACYFFALLFFSSCSTEKGQAEPKFDLDDINKKGKLTVLMDNSALSYFEYKGKNLGFEYFTNSNCLMIKEEKIAWLKNNI